MIKNFLLITYRSLMKNKLFIFINIFGLAVAIACCVVGYFNYDFNDSFDSIHKNASRIYRVNSVREFQNQKTTYGVVPIALGNVVKQNVSDVQDVIRYSNGGGNFRVKEDLFEMGTQFVDTAFFRVFTFDFIEGNGSLADKTNLILSDELAKKYFGTEKAIGKNITQILDSGKTKQFTVTGVFRNPPDNSSFGFNTSYTHYDNQFETDGTSDYTENSWKSRTTLFVTVGNPSRLATIRAQLIPYVENNNKVREDFIIREFKLDPFIGMAVRDEYDDVPGTWTRGGSPIAAVVGISVMGIFVLLIACFNLTNTAIAISSRRLKEIGIRKVMGSQRKDLIIQFIGETMMICIISLVLGILLAEYVLIPAFNNLWPELKLVPNYLDDSSFIIFTIGTLLFTGLLAGAYPAFYISKFQPITILKGKLKFGGNNWMTYTLLTLQFVISLTGVVCSLAFTDNARFQRDFNLGFDRKGVVFTYVNGRSEYETYRNAILQNPDVLAVAGSQHHVTGNWYNDPIKSEGKEIETDIMDVGDDYIKTVGLTFIEGRDFVKDSETDRKESVIITEELAQKFGWDKPLGKEITWMDTVKLQVIGVVKNVYARGLWDPIEPMMIRYGNRDKIGHILVSTNVSKLRDVNKFMEAKWKEIFPDRLYNGRLMDEELSEANTVNNNIVKMFIFLGIVALLLSATGLFTLVSLNIIKKMKEIGVRKVLGASVANISRIINKEFAIVLLIACVLGGWLGSFMAGTLMRSIWTYYQNATIVTLLISSLVMLITSILSIGYKVIKTTRINPSTVLRDE
jgi:ABC-type antimicrobial peptide transport system permease subunit